MANAQQIVTFENKVDRRITDIPRKNKIVADDINQLKNAINAFYNLLKTAVTPTSFVITESDFEGDIYANTLLINKIPMIDFYIMENNGNGTLLNINGENFNSNTGTLTILPDNYYITIYKKII